MVSAIEAELLGIIEEYKGFQSQTEYDDCSDVMKITELNNLSVRCIAAVERGAGRNSIYFRQVVGEPTMHPNTGHNLAERIGIV